MQDSESNYPLHQQRRNGRRRPPEDEDDDIQSMTPTSGPARSSRPVRSGGSTSSSAYANISTLPPHGLKNSLIAGAIAGVLCIGQSIIITLANAPTYHAYEVAKDTTTKSALAFTIFSYGILTFVISMLICLVTGFIVGRIAVARRLAFLAGFVAGLLVYLVSFIVNFIPNYPGSNASSGGGVGAATGGIILVIIFLIVWGVVGGLVSLLGGWLATRRHPHYMSE